MYNICNIVIVIDCLANIAISISRTLALLTFGRDHVTPCDFSLADSTAS